MELYVQRRLSGDCPRMMLRSSARIVASPASSRALAVISGTRGAMSVLSRQRNGASGHGKRLDSDAQSTLSIMGWSECHTQAARKKACSKRSRQSACSIIPSGLPLQSPRCLRFIHSHQLRSPFSLSKDRYGSVSIDIGMRKEKRGKRSGQEEAGGRRQGKGAMSTVLLPIVQLRRRALGKVPQLGT